MAIALTDQRTRFATLGARFMRNNHDNTVPVSLDDTGPRFLGFANTVDLSSVLTDHAASLTISLDGVSETKTFTCTASSESAVSVSEAVTDLTTSDFTGITWSADATTGRLKGKFASGKYVTVYGPLAAALDFGQALAFGGNGLEFCKYFDDEVIDIGLPKNIKEAEEIDLEGAQGSLLKMIIGAMLQGIDPVLTLKKKDYKLIQLIQGGTSDATGLSYEPPLDDETEHPTFFAEIFSGMYGDGSHHQGDNDQVEMLHIRNLTGMEGDIPVEAKAWAKYAFNLKGVSGWSDAGAKLAPWIEIRKTVAQFDAMAVESV
jgi:hypothetical protein